MSKSRAWASVPWASVMGQRAVMLKTYKRDGSGVTSPVGYGLDGEALYFMTDEQTWKVKRLARNPRVELAASTLRGQLRGDWHPGVATEVTGTATEHVQFLITRHNRLAWFFLLRRARRRGRTWRYYAVKESS